MTTMTDTARTVAELYGEMYESLCSQQQIELLEGKPLNARKTGQSAVITRRAYLSQIDNPDSPDVPYKLCCPVCTGYMTRVGRRA